MERVLVTGSEGFIGKHVTQLLDLEHIEYDTLDVYGNPTWRHDIREHIPFEVRGYSHVIHLAGLLGTHELFDDVMNAIDVNVKGTVNVLRLAHREGAEFRGITMDHVWVNPYETTKLAAERLAHAWSREYDFPVTYTTVYNAFGEYQAVGRGHPQKIIPTFATHAWRGEPMPIWGNGNQVVDLVYAGDVAKVLVDGTGEDGGRGVPMTVNEVAKFVWRFVRDDRPKIEYLPMRKGEHTPRRDPVARNPLWSDSFWFDLRRTVHWYKDRLEYP